MSKPRPWTVNQPGPLKQVSPNLWVIDDQVPGLPNAGRRMGILRLSRGSLLFFNAVPVPESTLQQILALGRPEAVVLPNQFHALDAAAFSEKLKVTPYAPAVAVPALSDRLQCKPIAELPADAALKVFTVEGFRTHEIVLLFEEALIVADLVTNVPHHASFTGLMMRLVGFTGPEPRLPKPVRKRVERDTAAVKALLGTLAALPNLKRLVPTHGDILENGVPAALTRIAQGL